MGIILGLSAALFWGTADFLVRYTTRIIGTYRTLFYMQFIGLTGLSIFLVASGEFSRLAAHISWQWWLLALITALLNVICALALYRSFEIGVLAIVSPIAASSTALTVVLAIISGEMISLARGVGITAALIGVALAATHFTPPLGYKRARHSHEKHALSQQVIREPETIAKRSVNKRRWLGFCRGCGLLVIQPIKSRS